MAQKPKASSLSDSDFVPSDGDQEKSAEGEDVENEGSPRGNTPPRSPTPEVELNESVPTPPPSPTHTTMPVFLAPISPPISTQPASTSPLPPPVSTFPISTAPLPPPIIFQVTTTTTTEPLARVNVSDMGAPTVGTETPITPKPLSPSSSTDSEPILSGDNFDFDSTYYSPYRLQSEDEDDAPVTRQHLKSLN